MRTQVYIDGFNLYYGCLKGTPYNWLDLTQLCARLLRGNRVLSIKYFTARIQARADDPDQPTRQQTYLRALRTLPNIEILFGQFLTNVVRLPRADGRGFVRVLRTEEKGSDVNLATHLIHDAHLARMACAVVITNDSDLAEPLRIVHQELGITVGVISPTYRRGRHPSRELIRHADFVKRIRKGVLRDSQLPDPVVTEDVPRSPSPLPGRFPYDRRMAPNVTAGPDTASGASGVRDGARHRSRYPSCYA